MPSASAVALRFQSVAFQHVENDLPLGAFEGFLQRAAGRAIPRRSATAAATAARQVVQSDRVRFAKQHGPLDDVLQLAHVARPAIALERRSASSVKSLAACRTLRRPLQEVLRQQRNIRTRSRSGGSSTLITLTR